MWCYERISLRNKGKKGGVTEGVRQNGGRKTCAKGGALIYRGPSKISALRICMLLINYLSGKKQTVSP